VIVFAGADLDRAAAKRRLPGWLADRRADPRARAVLMSERGVWLDGGGLALAPPGPDAVFLGLADGAPMFADDVSGSEPESGHPAGLREAATELPADEAALAAYAGSLLSWHRRHRFCANCGKPTEPHDGGHERVCPACDTHHFPRVAVEAVTYAASQPWPFPSSLMLGFSALAERGRPFPGDNELAEVRWFERTDLERAARGEGPPMLAPPYSIARRLIDDWLAEGQRSGRSG
jgi:NAD+ diphosphatase